MGVLARCRVDCAEGLHSSNPSERASELQMMGAFVGGLLVCPGTGHQIRYQGPGLGDPSLITGLGLEICDGGRVLVVMCREAPGVGS